MTDVKQFKQCRLKQLRKEGFGVSETVAYIPTHGTNGVPVKVGHTVVLKEDDDQRPWDVVSVSDQVVNARYFERKRRERRKKVAALG